MASDQPSWWQPVIDACPEDALALEVAAGQQQRFVQLDTLATRLLTAALHGQPTVSVVRSTGPQAADHVKVLGLSSQEKAWCAETFGVPEQQRRGAWYLPQKLSLNAGAVNLSQLVRERPAHALTLAADDSAGVSLVDGAADAVLLWAVLVPLFETLIEPIRVRAAGPGRQPTTSGNCGPASRNATGCWASPAMFWTPSASAADGTGWTVTASSTPACASWTLWRPLIRCSSSPAIASCNCRR